jgi:hypothetical protein
MCTAAKRRPNVPLTSLVLFYLRLKVSFVAILQTSHASFIKAGHGSGGAYFYTTICFFAGVLMMVVSPETKP